mmetsp:Transcript_75507/g.179350  ORF Transcript_75507/g.179350 Transcript_75507/m.179350 type:complete len:442 (+) Transcript_75507:92-1417(+)
MSRARPLSPGRRQAKRPRLDEEVVVADETEPPANSARPEDLEPGTAVLYGEGLRGSVRDAYPPLDEFWVNDADGELIRDENGDIIPFRSAQLQLIAPNPRGREVPDRSQWSGVILLGTEEHMTSALGHFGSPGTSSRCVPQQLLAIPAILCDPNSLLSIAEDGVDQGVVNFAKRQRPDILVATRAFQLKQGIEQLGADFRQLSQYYCLVAVQVPYSWKEIEEVRGSERQEREKLWNQIDLCVTATGKEAPHDTSGEATARRVLGSTCGLAVSDDIWNAQAQIRARKDLQVQIPLEYTDEHGARIFIVILPTAVTSRKQDHGILLFEQPAAAAPADGMQPPPVPPQQRNAAAGGAGMFNGKTINEWERMQSQWSDLPKLPPGWLRVQSRQSGETYFFNKRTMEATFDMPLPDGWTRQVSKSSGKKYYFHAEKRLSQYERPTE